MNVEGELPPGHADVILSAVIAKIGTGGGQGHVIDIPGQRHGIAVHGGPDDDLQHEHRSQRPGRAWITPDETTYEFLRGRPQAPAPTGMPRSRHGVRTDADAEFDAEVYIDASTHPAWGTDPGPGVSARFPDPELMFDDAQRQAAEKALSYMDLRPGTAMRDIAVDPFVGSCTNRRIEDLRVVAEILRRRRRAGARGHRLNAGARAGQSEGLGEIFTAAGAEWRQAGCSMCLGMNPDQLAFHHVVGRCQP